MRPKLPWLKFGFSPFLVISPAIVVLCDEPFEAYNIYNRLHFHLPFSCYILLHQVLCLKIKGLHKLITSIADNFTFPVFYMVFEKNTCEE